MSVPSNATLDDLSATIHGISVSKGFTPPSLDNLEQKLLLSVTELSECLEEHRKDRGLHYYSCTTCGARSAVPEDDHFIAGSPVVDAIYRFFYLPSRKVKCPGSLTKPEGILPELADSTIRNLHMMFSIILLEGHDRTVGEVIEEKVRFNETRPHLHGGNRY